MAQELKPHGYDLYYYDNKKNGEVDYLIDDADNLPNIPIYYVMFFQNISHVVEEFLD